MQSLTNLRIGAFYFVEFDERAASSVEAERISAASKASNNRGKTPLPANRCQQK
jgi:hypothetical protein